MNNHRVIAVCGKGGVGKTAFTTLLTKVMIEDPQAGKLLVVDADPALGLHYALGRKEIKTIGTVRDEILRVAEEGDRQAQEELADKVDYLTARVLDEGKDFSFLAMGHMESKGCFCSVNDLLQQAISYLTDEFNTVLIDGEAGIEQINRRVLEKVTHLLLVSDQSRKGIQVVGTIKQVADELVMYDRIGAVINRVTNPDLNKFITIPGVEILSYIESDDYHAANDIQGKTVYDLPPESSVYRGTKEVLEKFGIL